jgi:hypothetical protein
MQAQAPIREVPVEAEAVDAVDVVAEGNAPGAVTPVVAVAHHAVVAAEHRAAMVRRAARVPSAHWQRPERAIDHGRLRCSNGRVLARSSHPDTKDEVSTKTLARWRAPGSNRASQHGRNPGR